MRSLIPLTLALSHLASGAAATAQNQTALPAPDPDPLRVGPAADPILLLSRARASDAAFRALVASAVERHPGTEEALATTDEAVAALREARERRLPSADLSISSYQILSREFSNDPANIIERSRSDRRTDAAVSVQQTLFDFGAGEARVAAAGARLRAAGADADFAADRVALATVAAWYDVFGYRALVALTAELAANQQELKAAVRERINEGVSAEGDIARAESYIASAQTRLARYRRLLANAEARLAELIGTEPPGAIERAPAPDGASMSRDAAILAAAVSPAVRSAEANANAARREAIAAKADERGTVSAGIDAGRYGVLETDRDYDVRGSITFRQRLFGGIGRRTEQIQARARSANARADRIREEASRDAAIAWADVQALEEQMVALEAGYVAARRSRDVIVERFKVARGSLFDVVAAEEVFFEAAIAYIQALTELDAARYVLLSRTGRLLPAFAIEVSQFRMER